MTGPRTVRARPLTDAYASLVAQAHAAGNRRTLRHFIIRTSTKLALEPIGSLLRFCGYVTPQ